MGESVGWPSVAAADPGLAPGPAAALTSGSIKSVPAGAGCQDRHVSLAIIGQQGPHGGAGVMASRMDHFFQRIVRFSFINVTCKVPMSPICQMMPSP
jgi:hypothetical protein